MSNGGICDLISVFNSFRLRRIISYSWKLSSLLRAERNTSVKRISDVIHCAIVFLISTLHCRIVRYTALCFCIFGGEPTGYHGCQVRHPPDENIARLNEKSPNITIIPAPMPNDRKGGMKGRLYENAFSEISVIKCDPSNSFPNSLHCVRSGYANSGRLIIIYFETGVSINGVLGSLSLLLNTFHPDWRILQ
jgi:hypothetical protein